MWMEMFTAMQKKMKDELSSSQFENRCNIESITKYINQQVLKDIQDDIDRETFGLYGLHQKQSERNYNRDMSPIVNFEESTI